MLFFIFLPYFLIINNQIKTSPVQTFPNSLLSINNNSTRSLHWWSEVESVFFSMQATCSLWEKFVDCSTPAREKENSPQMQYSYITGKKLKCSNLNTRRSVVSKVFITLLTPSHEASTLLPMSHVPNLRMCSTYRLHAFARCTRKKVKSPYEPSGSAGYSLSQFPNMKRLGVFLLPQDSIIVHYREISSIEFTCTHFNTWVERSP